MNYYDNELKASFYKRTRDSIIHLTMIRQMDNRLGFALLSILLVSHIYYYKICVTICPLACPGYFKILAKKCQDKVSTTTNG